MSESEEYEVTRHQNIWHLTEAGWIKDGTSDQKGKRAKGAFKTVQVETHASPRLGAREHVTELWEKPGNKRKVSALIKQFGYVPRPTIVPPKSPPL